MHAASPSSTAKPSAPGGRIHQGRIASSLHLEDAEFAKALIEQQNWGRKQWHVIANSYAARILASDPAASSEWIEVGTGDVGEDTYEQLKVAAKRRQLRWTNTGEADLLLVDATAAQTLPTAKVADIDQWAKNRDKVTGTAGRQGEISDKIKFEVGSQAAWCCQFEGCGDNLREHLVPGAAGNFSYFAHIVASSSDGPRGDSLLSPQLAQDPENILLMCDKCHRLIDRVAPLRYTREVLQDMRKNSIAAVRRCLDSLRYPAAQMLVIGGNIQGQPFAFDERVAEEAMWLQKFRKGSSGAEWFARNGGHLGASNSPAYWSSLFPLLKATDIPRLKAMLAGTSHDRVNGLPLAIFPLHSISVLVLAGRLLGESRSIHLFQFHRDQVSGTRGGQWAWPRLQTSQDKYKVEMLKTFHPGDTEASLLVYLTAAIPGNELPASLYDGGQWALPAIEVSAVERNHRVIGDPDDLELLGRALDDALRILQDEWRVQKVHLVIIAPVTACVRIGQKMQARFHPDFVLYERDPAASPIGRGPFTPTIQISSTEVALVSTGESISLS